MTSCGQKDRRALGPRGRLRREEAVPAGPRTEQETSSDTVTSTGPLPKPLATVGISVSLESPSHTSNDQAEGWNHKRALPPGLGTLGSAEMCSDLSLPSRDVPKPRHVQGASLSSVLTHPQRKSPRHGAKPSSTRREWRSASLAGGAHKQAPRSDCTRVEGEKEDAPRGRHVGFLNPWPLGMRPPRRTAPADGAHQNSPSSAFLSSCTFCLGSMSFHSGALGEVIRLKSLKRQAKVIIRERLAAGHAVS